MFTIRKMKERHLKQVFEIENTCFVSPWSYDSLKKDLAENKIAVYIVALERGEVVGYAGMWNVVNEGHILNIAVKESHRRLGIGARLMKRLTVYAKSAGMTGLTLEVRENNKAALALYNKFGFTQEGLRKNYYSNGENAAILWKYF